MSKEKKALKKRRRVLKKRIKSIEREIRLRYRINRELGKINSYQFEKTTESLTQQHHRYVQELGNIIFLINN